MVQFVCWVTALQHGAHFYRHSCCLLQPQFAAENMQRISCVYLIWCSTQFLFYVALLFYNISSYEGKKRLCSWMTKQSIWMPKKGEVCVSVFSLDGSLVWGPMSKPTGRPQHFGRSPTWSVISNFTRGSRGPSFCRVVRNSCPG